MFGYFRRRREERASAFIVEAISAQLLYEKEHSGRSLGRGHGECTYDKQQRSVAVLQRVQRHFHVAKQKPPKSLSDIVAASLADPSEA